MTVAIFSFLVQPSEHNTYADIEAVYECLETQYGVSQEDIILYGQSVGSGPTLHLAARLPRLRGVVLHSAILSGLRVLCHVNCTLCFDIYRVSISFPGFNTFTQANLILSWHKSHCGFIKVFFFSQSLLSEHNSIK